MSLLKRLCVRLSGILPLFRESMPKPTASYLFPAETKLETVTNLGTNIALDPRDIEEFRRCRITSIIHRKAKVSPTHELLYVYYVYESEDEECKTGCLIVERTVQDEDKHRPHFPSHSASSLPATLDSTTSVSDSLASSSSLWPNAYDCVTIPKDGKYKHLPSAAHYIDLCKLDIPEDRPLYMIDFIILLSIISAAYPYYKLFSKQYFWYADAVYKFFYTYHGGAIQTLDQYSKRAVYCGIPISATTENPILKEFDAAYQIKRAEASKIKTKLEIDEEILKVAQAKDQEILDAREAARETAEAKDKEVRDAVQAKDQEILDVLEAAREAAEAKDKEFRAALEAKDKEFREAIEAKGQEMLDAHEAAEAKDKEVRDAVKAKDQKILDAREATKAKAEEVYGLQECIVGL